MGLRRRTIGGRLASNTVCFSLSPRSKAMLLAITDFYRRFSGPKYGQAWYLETIVTGALTRDWKRLSMEENGYVLSDWIAKELARYAALPSLQKQEAAQDAARAQERAQAVQSPVESSIDTTGAESPATTETTKPESIEQEKAPAGD